MCRLYDEMGLNPRMKPKKPRAVRVSLPQVQSQAANDCWSKDFMSDSPEKGQVFPTIILLEYFNRQGLWGEADSFLSTSHVIRALEMLIPLWGDPKDLRIDNKSELVSKKFAAWKGIGKFGAATSGPRNLCRTLASKASTEAYPQKILILKSIEETRELTRQWREEPSTMRTHDPRGDASPFQNVPSRQNHPEDPTFPRCESLGLI